MATLGFIVIVLLGLFFYSKFRDLELRIDKLQGKLQKLDENLDKTTIAEAHKPVPQASPLAQPKPQPPAIPLSSSRTPALITSKPSPSFEHDFEAKFGSKAFTVVGAVAVIFGISFFLKYAFDHDLISELGRVIIGIVAGLFLIGLGEFLRKKYSTYAQSLAGLGLSVLYLSIYASFNYYHLLTQPAAFFWMILITGAGLMLSLHYDSEVLSGFAQIGGFLTPFLLSSGINNPHGLFLYILLLDAGLFALSFVRNWKSLGLLSFIGSVLVYASWFGIYYTPAQFGIAFMYLTVLFVLFLAQALVMHFRHKDIADQPTLALISLNPMFYYVTAYIMINSMHKDWMGLFTLGLAAIYGIIGFTTREEESERSFRLFMWAVGLVLLVIAVPVQFHQFVITMAWAAEGLAFIYIGFNLGYKPYRYLGHIIFALSFLRFLIWDATMFRSSSTLFVNPRFLTALLFAVFAAVAAYLYESRREQLAQQMSGGVFLPKNEFYEAVSALLFEIYAILFTALTWEVIKFLPHYWFTPIWAVLALSACIVGIEWRNQFIRGLVYCTFIVILLRLVLFDVSVHLQTYSPIFNPRVFVFLFSIAIGLILAWYMGNKREKITKTESEVIRPAIYFISNFLAVWLLSSEILDYYNRKALLTKVSPSVYNNIKNAALSVSWAVYGALVLAGGIIRKSSVARIFAIILLWLVVLKVFLYDAVNLNNLYRFISYITLGIILLLAGYLYSRYKERITHFIKSQN